MDFLAFHLGHIDGESFDFCLERVRPNWLFVGAVESDELLKFYLLGLVFTGWQKLRRHQNDALTEEGI